MKENVQPFFMLSSRFSRIELKMACFTFVLQCMQWLLLGDKSESCYEAFETCFSCL